MANGGNYDLVVLGGGPGGYACAFRAALMGLKVAMVERDKVGGTCLHRGCIPTKALLHAAEIFESIGEAKTYGIQAGDPSFDWAAVQKAKSEPIRKLHGGLSSLVKSRKIDLIQGEGSLGEPGTIDVKTSEGNRTVAGRAVVLAVGSYARSLPGLEPDGKKIITSDHALTNETLPGSAAVIGAGAVGVEFASVYRSFGVDVTLIEALPRIVPLEDPDISKELTKAFGKRGINVMAGSKVEDADSSKKMVRLTLTDAKKTKTIEVDQVLVAVGRGPATDSLDLDSWGIRSERGYILAGEDFSVADGVWAIGDCVAGVPQLAHAAFAMGFNVAEQIADGDPRPVDFIRDVPKATYCVPEIASVGYTQEQATEAGYEVTTTKHSYLGVARAQILHQATGFTKLVADADGTILGIHMIGPRVTESIAEALLAVGWEASTSELAGLVHPHPTLSESVGEAALAAIGRPLH